jgi:hypothetical protein
MIYSLYIITLQGYFSINFYSVVRYFSNMILGEESSGSGQRSIYQVIRIWAKEPGHPYNAICPVLL